MTITFEATMDQLNKYNNTDAGREMNKIPWTISDVTLEKIVMTVWVDSITEEQFRSVKKWFGPLVRDEFSSLATMNGSREILDGSVVVDISVYSSESCEDVKIDPVEGPTTMQIIEATRMLKEGKFVLRDCKTFKASDESVFCKHNGCMNKNSGNTFCHTHRRNDGY